MTSASIVIERLRRTAVRLHALAQERIPFGARAAAALPVRRHEAIAALNRFSHDAGRGPSRFRRVLIDGLWDNPIYWTRYALFRAAMGLTAAEEIGVLGVFRRPQVGATFRGLGIHSLVDFPALRPPSHGARRDARQLLAGVRTAEDVMRLSLPAGFPSEILYDGLLSRQRRGSVDPRHPMLVDDVADGLRWLEAAERLFSAQAIDLVVMSHALNFDFSALVWAALRRRIPVVTLYGDFGTNRFIRIESPADLRFYVNSPTAAEMDAVTPDVRQELVEAGTNYLDRRLGGRSNDIGAFYAFQRRRTEVDRVAASRRFGWDPAKPLICVFAANWFDFPHSCAMDNFRDFEDWIRTTVGAARNLPEVNWLFKAHPCDEWYASSKGPTLADILAEQQSENIGLVPTDWNGRALLEAIDGGITYFGTVGLELAFLGKPVLVADRGWYGSLGFAHCPKDRADYQRLLAEPWWRRPIVGAASRAAELAGWYFSSPRWHEGYLYEDDSRQDAIYPDLQRFLARHARPIDREIGLIREWMATNHRFFQVFKIKESAARPLAAAVAQ